MTYATERLRGIADSNKQIAEVLQLRWPKAFPPRANIRPLELTAVGKIAAALGWSHAYARGVLTLWKMSRDYCQAVLSSATRITLDGEPAELVDNEARELARQRLAVLKARDAAKKAREAEQAEKEKAAREQAAKPKPLGLAELKAAGIARRAAAEPRGDSMKIINIDWAK
jgi:sRNA-binding protein